jgi:hypothetical protein
MALAAKRQTSRNDGGAAELETGGIRQRKKRKWRISNGVAKAEMKREMA